MLARSNGNDQTADFTPSLLDSMLPPLLGLIALGALACGIWASGHAENILRTNIKQCAAIAQAPARLACFDRVVAPHHPPMGALVPSATLSSEEAQRGR